MKTPGIQLGKFGLFGEIDPADFLSRQELAEAKARYPELGEVFGGRGNPSSPRPNPTHDQPRAPAFPLPHFKPTTRKKHLPVINQATGLRDCTTCPAPCCLVLAAEITEAEARTGKWEYVTEGGRHFLARPYGRCAHLGPDNMCKTYADRPRVCLDYRCDLPGKEDLRIAKWMIQNCK